MGDTPPRPSSLDELLARVPTATERQRRFTDLVGRVRLVRAEGWDSYRHVWSAGEVAGVALVLNDGAVLDDAAQTEMSTLEVWAASLWGVAGGEADRERGYMKTRTWLQTVRDAAT